MRQAGARALRRHPVTHLGLLLNPPDQHAVGQGDDLADGGGLRGRNARRVCVYTWRGGGSGGVLPAAVQEAWRCAGTRPSDGQSLYSQPWTFWTIRSRRGAMEKSAVREERRGEQAGGAGTCECVGRPLP